MTKTRIALGPPSATVASERGPNDILTIARRQLGSAALVATTWAVVSPRAALAWLGARLGLIACEMLAARLVPANRWLHGGLWRLRLLLFAAGELVLLTRPDMIAQALVLALVFVWTTSLLLNDFKNVRRFLLDSAPQAAVLAVLCFKIGQELLAWGHPAAWLLVALLAMVLINGYLQSFQVLRRANATIEERTLAAEAANAAKSAFLATMSHEIRTPLNGVLGMAQAMESGELVPLQRERVQVIRQCGDALLAILNDILDLAKIEAGRLELEQAEFDIDVLALSAHAAFTALANKKGLSFALDIDPDAHGVYLGDSVRVRQILYNLISNALKFTEHGEVRVRVRRPVGGLTLLVSDTGPGIAPDKLDGLFDKFTQADASTTRRFGGTGLGLSICRELAYVMGGQIQVESALGRGSVFEVILPLPWLRRTDPQTASRHAEPQRPGSSPLGLRVLAAEDNPVNQIVLKTLLHQFGVELTLVENGRLAVEAWRREPWDVILMDVQMPVLDGPSAVREIRAEEARLGRPRTRIVALTANAMANQLAEYDAAGMDGHVAKPIEVAKLLEAVVGPADAEAQPTRSQSA